jgi:hypothetical protein
MGSIISICRGLCLWDANFGRNNSHKPHTAITDSYVMYSKLGANKEQIEGLIFQFASYSANSECAPVPDPAGV